MWAVGTRTFDLDNLEKLSGGELDGVAVSSDGIVRPGLSLSKLSLPEHVGEVMAALVLADGSVLLGTGHDGKVVKVARDQATVFAEIKEMTVLSLAQDRAGTIFAGTTGGKIFKVSQGSAQEFATLPEMGSVNALVVDKAGQLLAAGGVNGTGKGKVFVVKPGNQSTVLFESDDPFVVSLAVGPQGEIYAGSHGKGLLYKFENPHKVTVVFDPPGDDVKAVAVSPQGWVYAISNEYAESGEGPRRVTAPSSAAGAARTPPSPGAAQPPQRKQGKGSLYRFDREGRPERLMHHDEFTYASLSMDTSGNPYVGTSTEGRVYTVDDAHVVILVADTDEREVGALQIAGPVQFVATTDPAMFHRVVPIAPNAASKWTSKVLDAGVRARFGHTTSRVTGGVTVSTRTGNTATPDTTWSQWTDVDGAGTVTSPPGRFFQVRAQFRDRNSSIADVVVPFVTDNLRPVVTEVTAKPKTGHETHETKDALPSSGGEPPKHDSVLKVSWKVDNPDSDSLRYRIAFQRDGQTTWRDATRPDEIVTKSEYEWETAPLPEGKYRLRVDASDELANPPGDVQSHALVSAPVLVDNTPPRIDGLAVAGRRLKGRVVDGLGPIARVEISVDGRNEWRPLGARDGLFDTAAEDVDADVSSLVPPGPHIVAVRAFDAAGNSVVQDVEAR